MIFTHKKWSAFCAKLASTDIISCPACEITSKLGNYLVLKHDVETNVPRAFQIAKIEHRYGHRGSYYVQAYLLDDPSNVQILQKMQEMGHEISYHYDVMDSCKGDLDAALLEFEKNRVRFEEAGFLIQTVCQHGNPVIERVGYTSNRDFFRSKKIQQQYPEIADIMVNYAQKYNTEYLYFSDAGRKFQNIYDPFYNDIVKSDDKNIPYDDLNALFSALSRSQGNIVSMHPHRWTSSALSYTLKNVTFQCVKAVAKVLIKVPVFKKIMSRYYYLAKKI